MRKVESWRIGRCLVTTDLSKSMTLLCSSKSFCPVQKTLRPKKRKKKKKKLPKTLFLSSKKPLTRFPEPNSCYNFYPTAKNLYRKQNPKLNSGHEWICIRFNLYNVQVYLIKFSVKNYSHFKKISLLFAEQRVSGGLKVNLILGTEHNWHSLINNRRLPNILNNWKVTLYKPSTH